MQWTSTPESGAGDIQQIHGNTAGIKPSQKRALQALYHRRVPPERFFTPELLRRLCELSRQLSRQLGLLVDRRGYVSHVIVGDAHSLFIPELGRSRAGTGRFRGLRLLHTHLRAESLSRDDLTDLALLRLDLVMAVHTDIRGLPGAVDFAHLLPPGSDEGMWRQETRPSIHHWEDDYQAFIHDLESQFRKGDRLLRAAGQEAAITIGVTTGDAQTARRSLEELARLAETAGLVVADAILQLRRKLDGRTLVGRGKLQEAMLKAMHLGAEVLLFDHDLSPSQLRNLATFTELKVVDRTQLILDIFAQRATTREGKLQVEVAQLRYRRPRLAIMPTAMSRLTGGIGGRGPGESKLEINRRRADERLTRLERRLAVLARNRDLRRARRRRVGLPLVSIVGYTNAGKSTLLNTITRSQVNVEDKLFATLDPTSRRFRFPQEREIILTDTVGFIQRLPRDLVHAFKATLEEVVQADLLLHVVDATDPSWSLHLGAVQQVLESLGVRETPSITVFNKIDALDPASWPDPAGHGDAVLVSAAVGIGLDKLMEAIENALFRRNAADGKPAVPCQRLQHHAGC